MPYIKMDDTIQAKQKTPHLVHGYGTIIHIRAVHGRAIRQIQPTRLEKRVGLVYGTTL